MSKPSSLVPNTEARAAVDAFKTTAAALKLPSHIYFIIAGLLLLVAVLLVLVINVRSNLAKYSKDDYYKQLLVKNEYTTTQTTAACSNFGVYALQVDTAIAKHLNSGVIHTFAATKLAVPSFFYSVPTPKNGIMSVDYKSRKVNFLPVKAKSPTTSRFVTDILAGRVDFITWQKGMFRVTIASAFKDDMKEFFDKKGFQNVAKALDDVVVLMLIKLPTLSDLAEQDYALSQILAQGKAPNSIIQSFIGESTVEFAVDSLPNGMHVIGYKI